MRRIVVLQLTLCSLLLGTTACLRTITPRDRVHVPDELSDDRNVCATKHTFYADKDGDDFGDRRVQQKACAQPDGFVDDHNDCDDDDAGTYPGAIEVCDGVDRNCNGLVDDGAIDARFFFPDSDLDGYGVAAGMPNVACERTPGWVTNTRDCNDHDATIHPGAPDPACDGIDQDCSGMVDTKASVDGTEYGSLQHAITDAESGATITVCDGVHPLSARFEGDLTLQSSSEDAGAVQIISAAGGRILDVQGDSVVLRHMTFTGASSSEDGGAVRVKGRDVSVVGCSFHDNKSEGSGGALAVELSEDKDAILDIRGLVMTGNSAAKDGGGLQVTMNATLTLLDFKNMVFHQNQAGGNGGAVNLNIQGRSGYFGFIGTTAMDNVAGGSGGVVSAEGSHVVLRLVGSDARRNTAGEDGGFANVNAGELGKLVLHDALLVKNQAGDRGGALRLDGDEGSELFVEGTEARQNTAPVGGVVSASTRDHLTADLHNSTLWANHAEHGAAIDINVRAFTSVLDMTDMKLWENTGGPAISMRGVAGSAVMDWNRGEMLGNEVGMSGTKDTKVILEALDTGAGADDNDVDLVLGETRFSWDGLVKLIVCELEACDD